jgi:hypothetical protein
MKKHKFFLMFVVFAVMSILAGVGYGPAAEKEGQIDNLQYDSGQYHYYHTKRKWRSRKKGNRPFRKYLVIYLEDHPARYKDGEYFLEHLEQNALLMVMQDWPRDTLEIGYLETEDAGLREMYDIKYQGESLVDLEAIKADMRLEARMLLIFSIVGAILSLLSLIKYIYDRSKKKG